MPGNCLRTAGQPLGLGDLLENEKSELRICKYVGFDEAVWVLPEPKPRAEAAAGGGPSAQPVTGVG